MKYDGFRALAVPRDGGALLWCESVRFFLPIFVPFGQSGDIPVPADYDLDGKSDIAVFRPSNGVWYSLRGSGGQFSAVKWGTDGDIPQPGDYDNNTNDPEDLAVFRPSDRVWYILRSEGFVTQFTQFGLSDDIPATTITY